MKTTPLYYTSPDLLAFTARILEIKPDVRGVRVLLDQTAFYPRGGGQPADRGTLGGFPVLDVQKTDEEIWHILPQAPETEEITGAVDGEYRMDYRQQHTGQHILSAAFLRACGYATVSVHQGEDSTSIEFAVPDIPREDLIRGEEEANRIIRQNLPVNTHWTDSEGLKDFRLRRPSKHQENIRVVEIEGIDQAACGGLHLSSTGETGLVHLTGVEKIRGNTRTLWKIGNRAYGDYRDKTELLQNLSVLFSVPPEETADKARELSEQFQALRREIHRLKDRTAALLAAGFLGTLQEETSLSKGTSLSTLICVLEEEDREIFTLTGQHLSGKENLKFCLVNREKEKLTWIVGHGPGTDLPFEQIRQDLLPLILGRGGGRSPLWQGIGTGGSGLNEFLTGFRGLTGEKE